MRHGADAPRLPDLPAGLDVGEVTVLGHDSVFTEVELAALSLVDQHANGVALDTIKLASVDLSGSRLNHLRISDGALTACNLANVQARSATDTGLDRDESDDGNRPVAGQVGRRHNPRLQDRSRVVQPRTPPEQDPSQYPHNPA
jgi:hypothetical protein